ncbi:MAG: hypothetical protein ACRC7S_02375, partial [Cetobacterium sp.]
PPANYSSTVMPQKYTEVNIHPGALAPWHISIYMAEFSSRKTERFSREETDLLMHKVKAL